MKEHVKAKLTEARNKITDPEHWCQDSGARNNRGEKVSATDKTAVKWCAMGALESVVDPRDYKVLKYCEIILNFASQELFNQYYVIRTNDTLGHAAILEVFDKAIAKVSS